MHNDISEIAFRIFLSILLSSIIGIEREYRQKMAGLRTHLLVGVGSTLVVLTNLYLFDMYKDQTVMDPTRMMTGVVTGIGFLCAGAIIKAGDTVFGLTTAATLWIVSCIGIAVGAGHYNAALVASLAVFLVLTLVRYIEKTLYNKSKKLL